MQAHEQPHDEQSVAGVVEAEARAETDEERLILRWRFDQFLALGFDYVMSAMLADSQIDLNQVRRLVSLGCPCDTAARIVL